MTDLTQLIEVKLKQVQGVRKMYDMDSDYEQSLRALKVCIEALNEECCCLGERELKTGRWLQREQCDACKALAEVRRIVGTT